MSRVRWMLVTLVFAAGLRATAGETSVAITAELRGAWVKPDKGWHGSAVLLLHGFASDMDDAGGLYKRLAAVALTP